MRNPIRILGLVAASVVLLAAGEAPNSDIQFMNDMPVYPADAADSAGLPFIEENTEMAVPAIGPILPEAASLTELVHEVRSMEAVEMDKQMDCLATAVYYESKGEPLDGQLAVAQVIINRVEDRRFGNDICSVVMAPKQFSFVRGGQLPNPSESINWRTAQAVALIAMSDGWPEVVADATHFHATRVSPGWKLKRIATVGRHVFYR